MTKTQMCQNHGIAKKKLRFFSYFKPFICFRFKWIELKIILLTNKFPTATPKISTNTANM